jgi:hypothetical protein
MNIIEISNQLKDVPDQFLMKEVQVPSGAYPSYLVISELTRRKRMRESALKEAPQTTVAQDLADPGREQRQMAMAQAAQQMAAPSLNAAGLAAAPQAMESLAAQDAMGTTPPEMMMPAQGMAAGGVVSFKQGGDIPRFQNTGYVSDPMFAQSDLGGFTGKGLSDIVDLAQQSEKDKLMSAMTMPELQEFNRSGKIPERLRPSPATQATAPSAAIAPSSPPAAPSAPSAPAIPPFAMAPYKPRAIPTPTLPTAPTGGELDRAAIARQSKYKEDVPFRLGYLEKEMADRAKEMAGRRESNINEALIQAGLGIMGSKSPRFLQAVSEGGTAGLRAYQQGTKDIRASEDLLRQSKIDYNKAQMLYDQGKFNEGDKAKQQSIDEYKRGMERANTEDAMVTRRIATELQDRANYIADARLGLELSERPARMGLIQAQTENALRERQPKPIDTLEMTQTRNQAMQELNIKAPKSGEKLTDAQENSIRMKMAEIFRERNIVYNPRVTAPLNRGIQE